MVWLYRSTTGVVPAIIFSFLIVIGLFVTDSEALAGPVDVKEMLELPAPADEVWKAISYDCSAVDWHPQVKECTTRQSSDKNGRWLVTENGFEFLETDVVRSNDSMMLVYKVSYEGSSKPLPFNSYVAIITVDELENERSRMTWKSRFIPAGISAEDSKALVGDFYIAGMENLAKLMEK